MHDRDQADLQGDGAFASLCERAVGVLELALHVAHYRGGRDAPRLARVWKAGAEPAQGAVHVSMNDYVISRARDVPRVARAGMRFRGAWPQTEGALGLWVAGTVSGRRQVSVSVWRSEEDLRRFVRSPAHLQVMRDFRDAGDLITTAWTAERMDRSLIWRQACEILAGSDANRPGRGREPRASRASGRGAPVRGVR
jgi:hypothetical protein